MTDRRLLWAYPKQWRRRYGDELLALVEDGAGARGPSLRVRLSLLAAGVHERLREQALVGGDREPNDRLRAGSRVILVAWAALVVAGCGFAKFSEHWRDGVPSHQVLLPDVAFGSVVGLAVLGAATLLAVGVLALPALRGVVAEGRWREVRRPLVVATSMSLVVVAATGGLSGWAHHLSDAQRNGSSTAYSWAITSWAVVVVATIVAWVVAAIAVERRLVITPQLARAVRIGSAVLAACTVLIAAGMLVWWIALARTAPWVLTGSRIGTTPSAWAWPLPGEAAIAVTAAVLAVSGASRAVRSTGRRHGV